MIMISHVISHPCRRLKLPAAYVAAGVTSSSSSDSSTNPSSTPAPLLPPVLAASTASGAAVVLPSATGQRAAPGSHHCCTAPRPPPLLRNRQRTDHAQNRNGPDIMADNPDHAQTEVAQINQTRDLQKIENHFIEIVHEIFQRN